MKKALFLLQLKRSYSSLHCKWRLPSLCTFNFNYDISSKNTCSIHTDSYREPCVVYSEFNPKQTQSSLTWRYLAIYHNSTSLHGYKSGLLSSYSSLCKHRSYSTFTPCVQLDKFHMKSNILHCASNLFQPIKTNIQSRYFFTSNIIGCKADSKSIMDWKIDSQSKLLDTKHKLQDAKDKIEGARNNLIGDIQDTKSLMKERIDEIIEVRPLQIR